MTISYNLYMLKQLVKLPAQYNFAINFFLISQFFYTGKIKLLAFVVYEMFLKNQVLEVSGPKPDKSQREDIQAPQTSSFVEVYLCLFFGNGISKN